MPVAQVSLPRRLVLAQESAQFRSPRVPAVGSKWICFNFQCLQGSTQGQGELTAGSNEGTERNRTKQKAEKTEQQQLGANWREESRNITPFLLTVDLISASPAGLVGPKQRIPSPSSPLYPRHQFFENSFSFPSQENGNGKVSRLDPPKALGYLILARFI